MYYYDLITGEMVKGRHSIDTVMYCFDSMTGVVTDLELDDSYPDDTVGFIECFLNGYGSECYSAANPLVNGESVVKDMVGARLRKPVDFNVGPSSYNMQMHPMEPDPLGRYPEHYEGHGCWYMKFDADKVAWLIENVLNLSKSVAEAELQECMDEKWLYRYDIGSDHALYADCPPYGAGGPPLKARIKSVNMIWNVYIVDYEFGFYSMEDVTQGIGKMYLYRKNYNGAAFWSILADERK